MAKPRVHEIAAALDVDTKTAMRTLQAMGEFVKGPSSSLQPAVARRLREAILAQGVTAREAAAPEATRPAVTALPAPPGTRTHVKQPMPPELTDAKVVFAEVQDPLPKPVAAPTPTRTPARKVMPTEKRPVRPRPSTDRTRQSWPVPVPVPEPTIAYPPITNRVRAKPVEPAPAREKPQPERVVRLERATPSVRELPPAGSAPGDAELRARRTVVIRIDHDWAQYRISNVERQRWIAAGLKIDQAHIAAMCNSFRCRGLMLSATTLNHRLPNGRTVLDEFNDGANVVDVLLLLAEARGLPLEPEFDPRIIGVLKAVEDDTRQDPPLLPTGRSAVAVPRIADVLFHAMGVGQTRPEVAAFHRERIVYEKTGRQGPLLRLYARAHGVFEKGDLLSVLLDNLPLHAAVSAIGSDLDALAQAARHDRKFYHVSGASAEQVRATPGDVERVPDLEDLPSSSGVALLQSGPTDADLTLLIWRHTGAELFAATLPYTQLLARGELRSEVASLPIGAPLESPSDSALHITIALAHTIRQSLTRPPREENTARDQPGRRKRLPRARTQPADPPSDFDEGLVVLVYAAGDIVDDVSYIREGHRAVTRWLVGGHYRRQPYPSTGEVKTIWIEAHEAGARDGHLLHRDRVRVLH